MKNKDIFVNIINDNRDKILNYCKNLLKESFLEPSPFSGWSYRVAIDLDGELDYIVSNNNSFIGEHEGTMLCVAKFPADYGTDIDIGSVYDNMTTEEYNDYAKWYCETYACVPEDIDEIYCELNDWEEVKKYKPEIYNETLEMYVHNQVECILDHTIDYELDELIETLTE